MLNLISTSMALLVISLPIASFVPELDTFNPTNYWGSNRLTLQTCLSLFVLNIYNSRG